MTMIWIEETLSSTSSDTMQLLQSGEKLVEISGD
jgi:hypothetical protein